MKIDLANLQALLPKYYLDFLAEYPLADCQKEIRRKLPSDLGELKELNRFYREDITDSADEELGALFLVGDDSAHRGEILAIDTSKPDDSTVFRMNFKSRKGDLPFISTGQSLDQHVKDLLAQDQILKERHANRRWWEFWK